MSSLLIFSYLSHIWDQSIALKCTLQKFPDVLRLLLKLYIGINWITVYKKMNQLDLQFKL